MQALSKQTQIIAFPGMIYWQIQGITDHKSIPMAELVRAACEKALTDLNMNIQN